MDFFCLRLACERFLAKQRKPESGWSKLPTITRADTICAQTWLAVYVSAHLPLTHCNPVQRRALDFPNPVLSLSEWKIHDKNHHTLAVMATRLLLMRRCSFIFVTKRLGMTWELCSLMPSRSHNDVKMLYKSLNHTHTHRFKWQIITHLSAHSLSLPLSHPHTRRMIEGLLMTAVLPYNRRCPVRSPAHNIKMHNLYNSVQ